MITSHDAKNGENWRIWPLREHKSSKVEPSNEIDTFPTQMLARDRTFVNTRLLNKRSLRYIIMADLIYRYEGITYLVSCRRAYETGPARRPRYHLNLTRDTAVCRRLYFYTGDVMHGRWQRTPSHGKRQEREVWVGRASLAALAVRMTGARRAASPWPESPLPSPRRRPRPDRAPCIMHRCSLHMVGDNMGQPRTVSGRERFGARESNTIHWRRPR